MNRSGLSIYLFILSLILNPVYAMEVCAPFEEADVAPELLATMLTAADNGRLYRIERDSSEIGFCVDYGFSTVKGEFKHVVGGLALQPGDHVEGQTLVLIKTNSLETGNEVFNTLARGAGFFNTDDHPDILFVSKRFTWIDATTGRLYGDLTLHGETHPVIFNIEVSLITPETGDAQARINIKAHTIIERSKFGMTTVTYLVGDEVRLCMSIDALQYEI